MPVSVAPLTELRKLNEELSVVHLAYTAPDSVDSALSPSQHTLRAEPLRLPEPLSLSELQISYRSVCVCGGGGGGEGLGAVLGVVLAPPSLALWFSENRQVTLLGEECSCDSSGMKACPLWLYHISVT